MTSPQLEFDTTQVAVVPNHDNPLLIPLITDESKSVAFEYALPTSNPAISGYVNYMLQVSDFHQKV